MKSHVVPLHPAQDRSPPFVQHLHTVDSPLPPASDLIDTLVIKQRDHIHITYRKSDVNCYDCSILILLVIPFCA